MFSWRNRKIHLLSSAVINTGDTQEDSLSKSSSCVLYLIFTFPGINGGSMC